MEISYLGYTIAGFLFFHFLNCLFPGKTLSEMPLNKVLIIWPGRRK